MVKVIYEFLIAVCSFIIIALELQLIVKSLVNWLDNSRFK